MTESGPQERDTLPALQRDSVLSGHAFSMLSFLMTKSVASSRSVCCSSENDCDPQWTTRRLLFLKSRSLREWSLAQLCSTCWCFPLLFQASCPSSYVLKDMFIRDKMETLSIPYQTSTCRFEHRERSFHDLILRRKWEMTVTNLLALSASREGNNSV